jgi:hypothetical protein
MQFQLLWVVDWQAGVEGLLQMLEWMLVLLILDQNCWQVFAAAKQNVILQISYNKPAVF